MKSNLRCFKNGPKEGAKKITGFRGSILLTKVSGKKKAMVRVVEMCVVAPQPAFCLHERLHGQL